MAADLDYFLKLSKINDTSICVVNKELVYISDAGISSVLTKKRLIEVFNVYKRSFGCLFWVSFIMRYIRRISTLLAFSL